MRSVVNSRNSSTRWTELTRRLGPSIREPSGGAALGATHLESDRLARDLEVAAVINVWKRLQTVAELKVEELYELVQACADHGDGEIARHASVSAPTTLAQPQSSFYLPEHSRPDAGPKPKSPLVSPIIGEWRPCSMRTLRPGRFATGRGSTCCTFPARRAHRRRGSSSI